MSLTTQLVILTALTSGVYNEPPNGEAPLPAGAVLRLGTTKLRSEGAMRFSSDGRMLVTGGVVMDAADGRRLASVDSRCHPVFISPDGRTVSGIVHVEPKKLPFREVDYRWVLRTVEVGTNELVSEVGLPADPQGGRYNAAAFSPDGKFVALLPAHTDGREVRVKRGVTVCEIATGKIHKRLEAEINRFSRLVAFSQDGKFLAAAGNDLKKEVRIGLGEAELLVWELDSGLLRLRIKPFPNEDEPRKSRDGRPIGYRINYGLSFLEFAPDSQSVAVVSDSSQMSWWSVSTGRAGSQVRPRRAAALGCVERRNTSRGCARGVDPRRQPAREIRILNAAFGDIVRTLATSESMWGAEFSPDGKRLAAVSQDRVIHMLDAATGLELGLKAGHQAMVTAVAFAPDGKTVATAARDNTVRLWDANTGRQVLQLPGPKGGVGFLGYSGDGTTLVVVGQSVQIRSAATGDLQREFPIDKDLGENIAVSRDARLLALSWMELEGNGRDSKSVPRLTVWDLVAGRRLHRLAGKKGVPWHMVFSADGTRLVVNDSFTMDRVEGNATYGGDLQMRIVTWDMRTGAIVADHNLGTWVGLPILSPDGTLAVGQAITGVIIWDTQTGRPVYRLPIGINPLGNGVETRFLTGGTRLFVDDTIWDWKTGKREQLIPTIIDHRRWWECAISSADGNRFATIHGTTVLLWDLAKLRASDDDRAGRR